MDYYYIIIVYTIVGLHAYTLDIGYTISDVGFIA